MSANAPRDMAAIVEGYLDETLSLDEHAALQEWLKASPQNAQQFAEAVLLHDRLRSELSALAQPLSQQADAEAALELSDSPTELVASSPATARPRVGRSLVTQLLRLRVAIVPVLAAAVLVSLMLWKGLGDRAASAATVEIQRLIAATSRAPDRTYRIAVEESRSIPERELADDAPERQRPTKPSLDGAVLHVRAGEQFVLIRQTADGGKFVTGSNGKTASWAVKPDGSVRVSADLNEFNRDVPGHEHSMPLIHIEEGLERLLEAYDVRLLPIEAADKSDNETSETDVTRLIVAVKKRQYRGPKRVEISYSIRSGLIQQMRFIEMPYGPERVTLRLSLSEERPLGDRFFDPESHHEVVPEQ